MNTAISIIVPVYNVEKSLSKCLDSILSQTFADFECILVDDGSNDKSPAICEEYAQKDNRLKVIHKESNMGLPLARKTGIESSSGDYILHVDSDDYIESDMLEKMYSKIKSKDYDMVYCDYYFHDKYNNILYKKVPVLSNDCITNIKSSILDFTDGCITVNKLIKKTIYDNLEFPIYGVNEDKYISVQTLSYSKTTGYVDAALYHYQYNQNSITNAAKRKKQKYKEMTDNYDKVFNFLKKNYGEDLSIFEPELSNRKRWIKYNNPENPIYIIMKILWLIIPAKGRKILLQTTTAKNKPNK